MRSTNSAFWAKLQADAGQLAEIIDLDATNQSFHWTTANHPLTWTRSGTPIQYDPFPGTTPSGMLESADLGVAVIDFVMANTGSVFKQLMSGGDFAAAKLYIGRVFVDTPNLYRMPVYEGEIGDYSFNRQAITGQARNRWKSLSVQWPYYTYQDTCAWRFGGTGCGFNTASITLAIGNASINVASSDATNILFLGGTLTNSYSNRRFDFGRLTVTGGVNSGQVRTIRAHTGDLLALSHPLPINSLANIAVSIYPGCRKRLIDDCTSLYNNQTNFLGWPWIPIQETAII
jgi:uncharacterized phage protein (TIGR02218 family)